MYRTKGAPARASTSKAGGDQIHTEQLTLLDQSEAGVRLNFVGKDKARQLARRVRPRIMANMPRLSVGSNEQQARNLVIEGDNLQAMVTLYRERGQVDLIITDPPYNTGNDFRYNDKWEEDPNDPGLGEFISPDDGARHTKWMRFMWPRLQMMKSMLKPGGVLAICIDHRELFHLGQILDELFREENRIAIINWQRAASIRNDKEGVSTATEYILVYAKDRDKAITARAPRTVEHDLGYTNRDNDPEGPWVGVTPYAPGAKTHKGMVYGVQHPFTGELIYPSGDQHWKNDKATVKAWFEAWGSPYVEMDLADGKAGGLVIKGAQSPLAAQPQDDPIIKKARKNAEQVLKGVLPPMVFTKGGMGLPRLKTHLKKLQQGVVPSTYWADHDYDDPVEFGPVSWPSSMSGTSEAGSRELGQVVGADHGFETVKPMKLFSKVIQLWCSPDGLVLDPFAGSGTSGHAVLQLNATEGSSRRFILIEQGRPERGDSYARTLLCDRLKRVISGKWETGAEKPLSGGFRFIVLRNKVDADAVLAMEREEMLDTVIATYFDAGKKRGSTLIRVDPNGHRYLVAQNNSDEGFFLVWDGPARNTDFTEEVYEAVANEAQHAKLKPVYHVYARFNVYQTENVRFYQIPDRILADFGLDIRSEPFHEDDE